MAAKTSLHLTGRQTDKDLSLIHIYPGTVAVERQL